MSTSALPTAEDLSAMIATGIKETTPETMVNDDVAALRARIAELEALAGIGNGAVIRVDKGKVSITFDLPSKDTWKHAKDPKSNAITAFHSIAPVVYGNMILRGGVNLVLKPRKA